MSAHAEVFARHLANSEEDILYELSHFHRKLAEELSDALNEVLLERLIEKAVNNLIDVRGEHGATMFLVRLLNERKKLNGTWVEPDIRVDLRTKPDSKAKKRRASTAAQV